MSYRQFSNALNLAKTYMEKVVRYGAKVIDATAGKGKDTLFLAQLVGAEGKVYAFDVQEEALGLTYELLEKHKLEDRVELILDSHHMLDKYVENQLIDGIMFNLGYLPGGNHEIITRGRTTCEALDKGLKLLKPGGLIAIVVYYGHLGGEEERNILEDYVTQLCQKSYAVIKIDFPNRVNNPPYLLLIEKAGGK